jgi:hypothetical protein
MLDKQQRRTQKLEPNMILWKSPPTKKNPIFAWFLKLGRESGSPRKFLPGGRNE